MRFDDISAKDWGNYSFNGESCQTHINISNGMGTIVDKLFDSLQNNIELNKTVDLILWEDDNCHRKTKIIRVRCSDGSVFTTNNLICTFSLGVLKENHLHLFSPLLPASHRRVIENIGFGTINKIFLRFEEKWWNDDWKGLQLVWKKRLDDVSLKIHYNEFFLKHFYCFRTRIGRNTFLVLMLFIRNLIILYLLGSGDKERLPWKS